MCSKCDAKKKAAWVPKVGDKGKTRRGQDYEIVYVNQTLPPDQRVSAVLKDRGTEQLHLYDADGYWLGRAREHHHDLMPPVVVTPGPDEVFLNIYRVGPVAAHKTEASARKKACIDVLAVGVRYVKAD